MWAHQTQASASTEQYTADGHSNRMRTFEFASAAGRGVHYRPLSEKKSSSRIAVAVDESNSKANLSFGKSRKEHDEGQALADLESRLASLNNLSSELSLQGERPVTWPHSHKRDASSKKERVMMLEDEMARLRVERDELFLQSVKKGIDSAMRRYRSGKEEEQEREYSSIGGGGVDAAPSRRALSGTFIEGKGVGKWDHHTAVINPNDGGRAAQIRGTYLDPAVSFFHQFDPANRHSAEANNHYDGDDHYMYTASFPTREVRRSVKKGTGTPNLTIDSPRPVRGAVEGSNARYLNASRESRATDSPLSTASALSSSPSYLYALYEGLRSVSERSCYRSPNKEVGVRDGEKERGGGVDVTTTPQSLPVHFSKAGSLSKDRMIPLLSGTSSTKNNGDFAPHNDPSPNDTEQSGPSKRSEVGPSIAFTERRSNQTVRDTTVSEQVKRPHATRNASAKTRLTVPRSEAINNGDTQSASEQFKAPFTTRGVSKSVTSRSGSKDTRRHDGHEFGDDGDVTRPVARDSSVVDMFIGAGLDLVARHPTPSLPKTPQSSRALPPSWAKVGAKANTSAEINRRASDDGTLFRSSSGVFIVAEHGNSTSDGRGNKGVEGLGGGGEYGTEEICSNDGGSLVITFVESPPRDMGVDFETDECSTNLPPPEGHTTRHPSERKSVDQKASSSDSTNAGPCSATLPKEVHRSTLHHRDSETVPRSASKVYEGLVNSHLYPKNTTEVRRAQKERHVSHRRSDSLTPTSNFLHSTNMPTNHGFVKDRERSSGGLAGVGAVRVGVSGTYGLPLGQMPTARSATSSPTDAELFELCLSLSSSIVEESFLSESSSSPTHNTSTTNIYHDRQRAELSRKMLVSATASDLFRLFRHEMGAVSARVLRATLTEADLTTFGVPLLQSRLIMQCLAQMKKIGDGASSPSLSFVEQSAGSTSKVVNEDGSRRVKSDPTRNAQSEPNSHSRSRYLTTERFALGTRRNTPHSDNGGGPMAGQKVEKSALAWGNSAEQRMVSRQFVNDELRLFDEYSPQQASLDKASHRDRALGTAAERAKPFPERPQAAFHSPMPFTAPQSSALPHGQTSVSFGLAHDPLVIIRAGEGTQAVARGENCQSDSQFAYPPLKSSPVPLHTRREENCVQSPSPVSTAAPWPERSELLTVPERERTIPTTAEQTTIVAETRRRESMGSAFSSTYSEEAVVPAWAHALDSD